MRKIGMVSVIALLICLTIGSVANAEMAKEGTDSGINIYTVTTTMAPLDKESYAVTYETLGVYISDIGKGPFHNMSAQNIGVICFDRGQGKLLGYIVMTAPDGDKVFCEIQEDKTLPPPNHNKGTGKYIGGTGKFAGIEGALEYTRYYVRAAKEGTIQAVAHVKSNWKLPEAKK